MLDRAYLVGQDVGINRYRATSTNAGTELTELTKVGLTANLTQQS